MGWIRCYESWFESPTAFRLNCGRGASGRGLGGTFKELRDGKCKLGLYLTVVTTETQGGPKSAASMKTEYLYVLVHLSDFKLYKVGSWSLLRSSSH
jgi:hypothetical protein